MAWYHIKSSKITGPVKLVLPGIIVSLIGGTLGVLVFNNPTKTKGKATQEAWHSVIQYEKIYDDNIIITTRYFDYETIEGLKKYKADIMHQIQMLSENFKNVKEEKNIDNRLLAIINCKVDTYGQILKLTDLYLDSLIKIEVDRQKHIPTVNETVDSYDEKATRLSVEIMNDYNRQRQHLIDRDSSTINNVLKQLTDSYVTFLYKYYFTPRLPDEYKTTSKYLPGSWEFLLIGGGFTYEKNKQGSLTLYDGYTRTGTWLLDDDFNLVLTNEARDSTFTYNVVNISDRTIRLAINDSMQLIGFRIAD